MKKYVFICLMALVGMVSCTYNYPSGEGCTCDPSTHLNKKTIDLRVAQSQWEFDNSANMYFCHFDVQELTKAVYDNGEISIHREYNSGTDKAYQVALPETTYKAEDIDNGDGTYSTVYYQQHIDYAFGVGFVEIFCTISDFYYEGFTPEAMLFRLQLTY